MSLRQILPNIDETDNKIIEFLVQGKSNQEISKEINVPLSTVQRRSKAILNKDIVTSTVQINYVLLGFKTVLSMFTLAMAISMKLQINCMSFIE